MNIGRGVCWTCVAIGVALYAIAAGCSLRGERAQLMGLPPDDVRSQPIQTTAAATVEPREGLLPVLAVGMQIQRTDWIDRYKESIDEVAALGATAVKIVCDARQEDGQSNEIYLDMRMTPTPDMLGELFRHADAAGLDVVFMPIVLVDDPKGNEWRGTIAPQSWDKWFDSYRDMLGHFLWIADGNGVDVFVVGSELLSSERQAEQWSRTIAFARERFGGLLTYSSNWDHYQNVPFWRDLDLIGMNSYWKLGDGKEATVEEIVANWRPIQRDLEAFVARQDKPLMFLEVGWCSLENAATEPWDYTQPVAIDLELQKRLWQGFWQAWHGTAYLGGMSVWEWPPVDGGPSDRGYTPKGKPAAEVIREWFGKERWAVDASNAS